MAGSTMSCGHNYIQATTIVDVVVDMCGGVCADAHGGRARARACQTGVSPRDVKKAETISDRTGFMLNGLGLCAADWAFRMALAFRFRRSMKCFVLLPLKSSCRLERFRHLCIRLARRDVDVEPI